MEARTKRSFPFDEDFVTSNQVKKFKVHTNQMQSSGNNMSGHNFIRHSEMQFPETSKRVSLVEMMRPTSIAAYVGQKQIVGPDTVLSSLLEKGDIPSMIFWGPPGCGKVKLVKLKLFYFHSCLIIIISNLF